MNVEIKTIKTEQEAKALPAFTILTVRQTSCRDWFLLSRDEALDCWGNLEEVRFDPYLNQ